MTTTGFDDLERTESEAHAALKDPRDLKIAQLEEENVVLVREEERLDERVAQLEEENRTVATYAAELERKLRRIEARAMNGWASSDVANAECEAIARIIKDEFSGDQEELEQVMQGAITDPATISRLMEDTIEPSEGGDPD